MTLYYNYINNNLSILNYIIDNKAIKKGVDIRFPYNMFKRLNRTPSTKYVCKPYRLGKPNMSYP